jgi:hypothetical protein
MLNAESKEQIGFFRKYEHGPAKSATYNGRKKAEEAEDIGDISILWGESASHRRFVPQKDCSIQGGPLRLGYQVGYLPDGRVSRARGRRGTHLLRATLGRWR